MTRLQRSILIILALGMLGSIADLVLLSHVEGWKQWLPFAVLILGIASVAWFLAANSPASRMTFIAAMQASLAIGLLGTWFHYVGNREFQLETDATQHGLSLFLKVIHAKAPPALAPASLCLFALFGLACARRPE